MSQQQTNEVRIAVVQIIGVDPKHRRYCLTDSWENCETPRRCHGIGTILDSHDLCCEIFPGTPITLYSPNGKKAQWGDGPIERSVKCLQAEADMTGVP